MKRRAQQRQTTARMPRGPLIWLAGAVVLLVVLMGVWIASRPPEDTSPGTLGPRLAVSEERIDLGNQPFNKMVRAEFTLTNQGDRPLKLDASTPIRVLEGC